MAKKWIILLVCLAALGILSSCGTGGAQEADSAVPPTQPPEVLMELSITAGETQMSGVLFDNETARAFAELLPLDVPLWDPAPGFARAFDLEEPLPDADSHTRTYELGGLVYWDTGPSVAILYSDRLEETIVPITTIGRIDDNVDVFTTYEQSIHIEAVPEDPSQTTDGFNDADHGNTVATATVTPGRQQTLFLWEEGNVPAVTEYTTNTGNYSDDPDFRPYLTYFPVPEGTEIRGAVLVCAGGVFQFRSDQFEGTPVAQALADLGYQSFVVDYRLRPYTQEEGALDLARAVRFVRAHGAEYGIDEQDIAVMGFSAGGILAGEMLRNYDGTVSPTVLDPDYVPDALDAISADAAADGMIYSFYGRLSVGTTDVESLREADLPPTFYCYGTQDPFYRQFLANADAVEEAGVAVERLQLDDMPHGFGVQGGWIPIYAQWLGSVFESN